MAALPFASSIVGLRNLRSLCLGNLSSGLHLDVAVPSLRHNLNNLRSLFVRENIIVGVLLYLIIVFELERKKKRTNRRL